VNRLSRLTSLSLVAAMLAGVALAQATPEELAAAVEARHNHMKGYGAALGVLGKMAQGEVAYDAAAATEAANSLVELSAVDILPWFLEGTEVGYPDSAALPAIWENPEDFTAKNTALNAAAVAMQAAAGVDLASLQAAMGAVGASCGGCHELYRQPN
jgi:cytochrome c556